MVGHLTLMIVLNLQYCHVQNDHVRGMTDVSESDQMWRCRILLISVVCDAYLPMLGNYWYDRRQQHEATSDIVRANTQDERSGLSNKPAHFRLANMLESAVSGSANKLQATKTRNPTRTVGVYERRCGRRIWFTALIGKTYFRAAAALHT